MRLTVYSNERGIRKLKDGVTLDEYRAKYPDAIKVKKPSASTIERWCFDGLAKTPCGCRVEPDGSCPHGRPSLLIVLGYI